MRADLEDKVQKHVATTSKNAPSQKNNNFMFHDPSITTLNVKPIDMGNMKSKPMENENLKGIDDFNNIIKIEDKNAKNRPL